MEWLKYLKAECRGKGSQDHHQLDTEEEAGRTSLMKRVSSGEIWIGPSDKGNGIVVMDMEMYLDISIVHTQGDREVDWKELEGAQKELRAHSRALAQVFQLGADPRERNQARCYNNMSSWACDPPVMRCLPKTHKPIGRGGVP